MANIRNGNTFYIDTQSSSDADNLIEKQLLVVYILVTATASNGRIVLADTANGTAQNKVDLRVPVAHTTVQFSFETNPLLFPNGLKPEVLSNAVVTVCIKKAGG